MKKFLIVASCLYLWKGSVCADDVFFRAGPLSLNVPFKSAQVTYLYDFNAKENLVGGETPVVTVWDKIEGDLGVVTSLQGAGTPFVGGNLLLGNVMDRYLSLPQDLKIGGYGGWNFNSDKPIYGLKGSYKIW